MKTVHRATTPKLQEAAQNASGAIRRFIDLLGDEIAKNSVEVPKQNGWHWGARYKRPETVTYKTKDIENLIMTLSEKAVELDWWSTPTELRAKLTKPRTVK
jgi:hypothetical protein